LGVPLLLPCMTMIGVGINEQTWSSCIHLSKPRAAREEVRN
jgi:hypothetical protein